MAHLGAEVVQERLRHMRNTVLTVSIPTLRADEIASLSEPAIQDLVRAAFIQLATGHVLGIRAFEDIRVHAPTTELPGYGQAESAQAAADGADVLLLSTSAAEAVIDVTVLPAGTLVTSISTNATLAREVDPAALASLDVYADLTAAAFAAAGEMRLADGFTQDDIRGDLPGPLAGCAPPPTGDRPVFFRSVGLGIEDAAVAMAVLEAHS